MQALLDQQAALLSPHFKPEFLAREETTFQFQFDEADPFYLTVTGSEYEFVTGTCTSATLTLYLDSHETCWALLTGRMDGMQAFMDGKYRADGNIVLSQLLLYIFKSDDPTVPYQVQD